MWSCAGTPIAPKLPAGRTSVRSELILKCTPLDAEVALDGVPQGTCEDYRGEPRGLGLSGGVHRISVTKRGHSRWDAVVETDGTRVVLQPRLVSLQSEGAD